MNPDLFRQKHELWLNILFTSFMIGDEAVKSELYDFSRIAFRHMRWIARALKEAGVDYTYDRTGTLAQCATASEALETLQSAVASVMACYPDTALGARMDSDSHYLLARLEILRGKTSETAPITAFDLHRSLPGKTLDKAQADALTLFLFEETYKEYELILVYAYMQNASDDVAERDIYQDLIDESHFHLKAFGNLMASMGILALPRPLDERTYKIADVPAFIRNGIEEEENAKEQCHALSEAIGDDELSAFFDFIDAQESYHIALMQRLLSPAYVSPK